MNPKALARSLKPLILLLAVSCIALVSYYRLFDNYELGSLDLRFLIRHPKIPTTEKIDFIEIGQDTIDKLGRFPFDRSYHAALVEALSEAGAKTILFDLLFSEPQEGRDGGFKDALDRAGNVYLPYAFDLDKVKRAKILSARGYIAKCLGSLAVEAKGTGHINIVPDPDGKFRRIPVFIRYEGTDYPHISFLMACDWLGIPLKDVKFIPGRYIMLGTRGKIPLDEDSNMMVNFSGKWGASYGHYSYVDILQSHLAGQAGQAPILDLKNFKDKICIVGLTATGTGDIHPNPFEPIYPGMGIHAEIVNSMINDKFIGRASRAANLAILFILAALISITTLKTKPVTGALALLLGLALFALLAVLLFDCFGIWIDAAWPVFVMALVYLSVTVYKYVAEWKARLVFENELGIAKTIQESFLPKKTPGIEGADIATSMLTARQVGGDLYDFVDLGKEKLGVMIGDVSGKGIPASLFMAMVAGSFKFFSKLNHSPKDVLSSLNSKLVAESSSDLFVTVFYAIFDMKAGYVSYSNGGHMPLLRLSRNGKIDLLDSAGGLPLGMMDGEYFEDKIEFEAGDVFIFYTDGVTEAMNSKSELYGKERLEKAVRSKSGLSSHEILKAIDEDVRRFEPKAKQHDDITVIVVKL
ncbi:MAG: SpoIIE family protein phosphatase [Candidatus Omnitrophica bacterium]|nr:SpoIIE family protein phosphatase [Candidatus Omnitrophota bacterium]MDD5437066.1 SpoIIE family protein phosphatase [Candidatus Omnitrophota bacterium]